MLTTEQNFEIWKENLRRNAEAHPDWGALRLIESTPHSGAFPVATGSLPVSSASGLLTNWYGRAMCLNNYRNTALEEGKWTLAHTYKLQADIYDKCADELRREMEDAKKRQPEENNEVSHVPAKPD